MVRINKKRPKKLPWQCDFHLKFLNKLLCDCNCVIVVVSVINCRLISLTAIQKHGLFNRNAQKTILRMNGYGDNIGTNIEVLFLFLELFLDLPPLSQVAIRKIENKMSEANKKCTFGLS